MGDPLQLRYAEGMNGSGPPVFIKVDRIAKPDKESCSRLALDLSKRSPVSGPGFISLTKKSHGIIFGNERPGTLFGE